VLLLYFGTTRVVARIMGVIVAFIGAAFLITALLVKPPAGALLKGTFIPMLPEGSSLLVLALIGTTVVPYNLFLGSGIASGQKIGELRFGIGAAVVLGGIISMGILVVGTAVTGPFDFEALSEALSDNLGEWTGMLTALGLFAAGFSSAITAPLAAAITARGLFCPGDDERWSERSKRYRGVWFGVLLVGVVFGMIGVRPIPVIILAQALNGVLLPFVAIFLFLVVNDRALMGQRGMNRLAPNICMGLVVAVTIMLGVTNVAKAASSALDLPMPDERALIASSAAVTAALSVPIVRAARRRRNSRSIACRTRCNNYNEWGKTK
jgi:Mn2+/Fe2+ NRAMP family transporter